MGLLHILFIILMTYLEGISAAKDVQSYDIGHIIKQQQK